MITIAVPPTNASPTLRLRSPSRTSWPSPPAPTTAAITTMPSAIMMVWLTPSMIEGFAMGSCTFMQALPRGRPEGIGHLHRAGRHAAHARGS